MGSTAGGTAGISPSVVSRRMGYPRAFYGPPSGLRRRGSGPVPGGDDLPLFSAGQERISTDKTGSPHRKERGSSTAVPGRGPYRCLSGPRTLPVSRILSARPGRVRPDIGADPDLSRTVPVRRAEDRIGPSLSTGSGRVFFRCSLGISMPSSGGPAPRIGTSKICPPVRSPRRPRPSDRPRDLSRIFFDLPIAIRGKDWYNQKHRYPVDI